MYENLKISLKKRRIWDHSGNGVGNILRKPYDIQLRENQRRKTKELRENEVRERKPDKKIPNEEISSITRQV